MVGLFTWPLLLWCRRRRRLGCGTRRPFRRLRLFLERNAEVIHFATDIRFRTVHRSLFILDFECFYRQRALISLPTGLLLLNLRQPRVKFLVFLFQFLPLLLQVLITLGVSDRRWNRLTVL